MELGTFLHDFPSFFYAPQMLVPFKICLGTLANLSWSQENNDPDTSSLWQARFRSNKALWSCNTPLIPPMHFR